MRIYFYKFTNQSAMDIIKEVVEPECEHQYYMAFQHLINKGRMWDLPIVLQNKALALCNSGYCVQEYKW